MKKAIIVSVCMAVAISAIAFTLSKVQGPNINNEADSNSVTVGYKYTVKNYNGMVAVFSYGSTYPIEILDCPLNSLPVDEAEKLSEGIDITDDLQLQALIEAYD